MKLKGAAIGLAPLILFGALVFAGAPLFAADAPSLEERVRRLEREIVATKQGAEVAMGREIYKAACMACHGINGDGKGNSARWLDPKPRDFTKGLFKWRSTPLGALPTDDDLERVVRDGVSGTDMVPFGTILSKKSRRVVVQYIKTFSPAFADPARQPGAETALKIPEKRPFEPSGDSVAKGKALYEAKGCSACHGPKGDGNGPAAAGLVDVSGNPIKPWNFRLAYFKGGASDRDLYRSLSTGLNGTPMSSFAAITTEEERWQLIDYIRSLGASHKTILHYLFVDEPGGRIYDKSHSSSSG